MKFTLRKKNSDGAGAPYCSGTLGRIRSLIIPRRMARDTEGAAAIEFALVFPVFLMVILGIIEVGRAFWVRTSMQFAVEEASRIAMATYTRENWYAQTADEISEMETYFSADGNFEADVKADAEDNIFGWDPNDANFEASYDSDASTLTVTATINFEFLVPFANFDTIPMTATTTTPLIK